MKEPKMHKAVVERDLNRLRELASDPQASNEKNRLGLTPFELAQYLGHDECASLLKPVISRKILVQNKQDASPKVCSERDFQDHFQIPYLRSLRFPDYATLKRVYKNCPYILRIPWLENSIMAENYHFELSSHAVSPVSVRWIDDERQYGLFSEKPFAKGDWIGEYTGVLRQYLRSRPDTNPYCIHYPTKLWSLRYFMIDAALGGNEIRFANHSDRPNTAPFCLVKNRLLHIILFTNREISKDEELTFNYGSDFWRKRTKRV